MPQPQSPKASLLCICKLAAILFATLCINGCHSANVNATVHNQTASLISLIQIDYPSASFGTQSLAPGQDFKYRFKVLGSGRIKITYTDAANTEHKAEGPSLDEGAEGKLDIVLSNDGAHWKFNRTPKSSP